MIHIMTPQFERIDGKIVDVPSFEMPLAEWEKLPSLSHEQLKALGLGIWDDDEKMTHWLYPSEWYGIIPAGLMVTTISGEIKPFVPGKTDDDIRFGCLAYGFIQQKEIK